MENSGSGIGSGCEVSHSGSAGAGGLGGTWSLESGAWGHSPSQALEEGPETEGW